MASYDPNIYQKLTQEEQILRVPDTYIGSSEKIERYEHLLTIEDDHSAKASVQQITLPEGIERLFLEILSNAGDNVQRSREKGIDVGKIDIYADSQWIVIRNGGIPIPVDIHPTEKIYVPEMIFGHLLTSSNYDQDEEKRVVGKNGYGAKLCNLFSKYFRVKVGDNQRGIEYCQEWSNNMKNRNRPQITEYVGQSYVEITYMLDFERFGYTEYPSEALSLFTRHGADLSFTCKVPVYFNNNLLDVQDIKKYTQLIFSNWLNVPRGDINMLTHYEWGKDVEPDKKNPGVSKDGKSLAIVELCLIDTPDHPMIISFVNGMITRDGGVHVETIYKNISNVVLEVVNGKDNVKGKGKGKTTDKPKFLLKNDDIKRHLSLVVSCRLVNPKFNSQSKVKLAGPKPSISLDDSKLKSILSWKFLDRLYIELESRKMTTLNASCGRKKRYIDNIKKLRDANWAGNNDTSRPCVLYITEGDSAQEFAMKAISMVPDGRNFLGAYPLRGVPLNTINANFQQYVNNKEITELKEALGLREGLDYLDDANFQTLRYASLLILTDADEDGHHIRGLILLLFATHFPSLLQRGYVQFLRTLLLKVSKGKEVHRFYTRNEYEKWKSITPDWMKWRTGYYKGLASNQDIDIQANLDNPRFVEHVWDYSAGDSLRLAFDSQFSDYRKGWISNYVEDPSAEEIQQQPITTFINQELIQHSIANLYRSIPGFDGQKPGQRKAIWTAYLVWGKKIGTSNIEPKKVSQLASSVNDKVGYHHGERSMEDTLVKMAQDFVGSNNMNIFYPEGLFGTRETNGKRHGASRYIFTYPTWWWPYIFRNEDNELLTMIEDEGKTCEPEFLLPIIPLFMVNGSIGIATGYSTYIPSFNPVDLCQWIKCKINDQPLPELIPWYRGFTGNITLKDCRKKGKDVETKNDDQVEIIIDGDDKDQNIDDENDDDDNEPQEINLSTRWSRSMISEGRFTVRKDCVIVDEIPIGKSISKYEEFLISLRKDKLIKHFNCHIEKDGRFRFEIFGMKKAPTIKNLCLRRVFGLSNMVLLDTDKKPIKFNNIYHMIDTFYQWRLPFYEERKQSVLNKLMKKINDANNRIKFIMAVIQGEQQGFIPGKTIVVFRKSKIEIIKSMDLLDLPHDLLDTTKFSHCTQEEINNLTSSLEKYTNEYNNMEKSDSKQLWVNDIDEFLEKYKKHYD